MFKAMKKYGVVRPVKRGRAPSALRAGRRSRSVGLNRRVTWKAKR